MRPFFEPKIDYESTTYSACFVQVKMAVSNAYIAGRNAFPPVARPPISTTPPVNAKYVTAVAYNQASATAVSVVLVLGNTGNTNIDGKFLGAFGVGQIDGTVRGICGTACSAASTAACAVTALYQYLPAYCRH